MEDRKTRYSVLDAGCSKRENGCERLRVGKKRGPNPMPRASRIQNTDSREQERGGGDAGIQSAAPAGSECLDTAPYGTQAA